MGSRLSGLIAVVGLFLSAPLLAQNTISVAPNLGTGITDSLRTAPLPGVTEYRAATERMLAVGETLRMHAEAEYQYSRAAKNYAEAALIRARVTQIQIVLTQIRADQRLLLSIQKATGEKVMQLLKRLDHLRHAKVEGYFNSNSRSALRILSGVAVDARSQEDVVEEALLQLRERNKKFQDLISADAEIAPLSAENFDYIPLDIDRRRAIAAGKAADPRAIPLQDFPGGSAAELYAFLINHNYRLKFGTPGYRILGVCLSAIETNALTKVQGLMEAELAPIRRSLIQSWTDLMAIQNQIHPTVVPETGP